MRRTVLTCLTMLAFAAPAQARPGDLDRTFAGGGRTALPIGDSNATPTGLSLVDGIRPLIVARAEEKGRGLAVVERFASTGRRIGETILPPAFGSPLLSGSRVLATARPDSTRLVLDGGTTFTLPAELGASFVPFAFRYDSAGRLVVVGGTGTGPRASAIAVRFLPGGQVDPSYGAVVLAPRTEVTTALITSDGRPYAAGVSYDTDGTNAGAVVVGRGRTWREAGGYRVSALIEGPGHTFLAAVDRFNTAGVLRLTRTLERDTRFSAAALPGMYVSALARDRSERIVVAGARTLRPQAKIVRFGRRGAPDRRFGNVVKQLGARTGVRLVASEARAVAVDKRGRIVVAGVAYDDDYVGIRDEVGRAYLAVARLKG